jgi:arabinogalactan oligomer / maltooligosaccharide transport system substrate-binding protein
MDKNHPDKTASEPIVTGDNSTPSSLSPHDQRGTQQLQNNRMEDIIKHSKGHGYKVTEEYRPDTPGQRSIVSIERDWLQFLIIPLLIALLGIGFTWVQNQTSLQIANDQQRETILKTYLDNMSDLLLNQHLSTSKPGDAVREVARERTLITLRRLDAARNTILLRFLQDTHLIGIQNAVINLSNADLSNDDLSGANLSGNDLSGTILNGAFLNDADLSGAHLKGAFLNGAFLGDADLSGAFLGDADLNGADLNDARNLVQHQLDKVYSCTNAMLSIGLTCLRSGSAVTLTYWYTEGSSETPAILQRIQQFRQQNPNIRIKAVYKPFLQTQAAFIAAAQAGKAPDVLRSDIGWVTQFAWQRYLLNIDSYTSQSHLDLSDYLSTPLSYDKYNGHLYGLPQVTDFLALLYNKAELAKAGITSAPATMSDFRAAAIKIVQSKAAKYGFETSGASYFALPFLWAFGGGMIDQQNNILVNNKGSVKGLTFLLKLRNTDKVMPAQMDFSNGYNNMVNDLKSGETAMIFDGPWEVSNILTGSAFTGNPSNLGIAGIPTGPAGQTGSPVGGQSYVISAGTAHPAEAYKFISFMSSTASQIAIAKANHTLPTRNSAYQDPGVSGDPVISAFHTIQNTAVARPVIPQGGYLFDAFDSNIQAALDGAESTRDALYAVADVWKELLY